MGYKYESTASGLHGTPDELFVTRCDEGHLNIVVSNSGKGNTVCVDQAHAAEVVGAVAGYAQVPDTLAWWRELRGKLIKDAADYRDTRGHYRRLHDTAGALIADASLTTVSHVLDLMDGFERQALREPESEQR